MTTQLYSVNIAVLAYPGCLQSAVFGLQEMLQLANTASVELGLEHRFITDIVRWPDDFQSQIACSHFSIIIIPPSLEHSFVLAPDESLVNWLSNQHKQGSVLASACAGVFILAKTPLLKNKKVTTHWGLSEYFRSLYPAIELSTDAILINQGDIITAGGLMSWLDLGLEVIAQFGTPAIMRRVGKTLVIDTGKREQRYYQPFTPSLQHGDHNIVALQHFIQDHFADPLTLSRLADLASLTERTLQRRFIKATGLSPSQYLQRVRIQRACDLLESSQQAFESISTSVGYDDVSACRKTFIKIIGLTPSEFRKRFH
ncbi:GlxA family transcriptional regulator [Marinomonas communis]|uniref:Transcriptional regulator GlxA family with amidase domain n=1 Tax=Marinomonas communis TaxID=28254 RepID=A0A4R6XBL3_9GAMM|nr:helix-turn-helix domain-containing protein [Marinomonas communis]TDR15020.1 transcriptional regulator GlxA family with amidase domain [Marinomonas communis]